ncbi:helix-turn-helix transcriptional regulator [Glycomyces sp. YM15]|uniref:helix-turn-helix domain-containing protein n=1 Tax=Glycomyces sp. YM15 TaxID=2800446 RepID=UPI0019628BF4|nr:helix-turn-helix transcriptional regulator [Glycomyces sp. YM15]
MPRKPGPEPSLRSQWLGKILRDLRKERGNTLAEAGEFIQRDATMLSRYENGEYTIRRSDVIALLTFYGVSDESFRSGVMQLCDDMWRTDWWDPYNEEHTKDFINVPWLESRAEQISEYQALVLHGLLQTPSYAEAVIRNAEKDTASEEQLARWLELRVERQRVLIGENTTPLAAVLEEHVLRRPIGGPKVMREQLEHLLEVGERSSVELRIMSTDHGPHSGHLGSFTLFEMPYELSSVAYVESLGGGLYIESPRVERFHRAWEDLWKGALTPSRSNALIKAILKEY